MQRRTKKREEPTPEEPKWVFRDMQADEHMYANTLRHIFASQNYSAVSDEGNLIKQVVTAIKKQVKL